MPPKAIMEKSKGVIKEGKKLVLMDNFLKRHRENNRRNNRDIDMAMQRQTAVAKNIIADPDRTMRAARLEAISMDLELFGTARTNKADLAPNSVPAEDMDDLLTPDKAWTDAERAERATRWSIAGSRVRAKNAVEVVSTSDINAIVSGESTTPPAAAKPQQRKPRTKGFAGFEMRRRGLARGRVGDEDEEEVLPWRAGSAYPGAPADPDIIPADLIDTNRGFWPKGVRQRVEAAEAEKAAAKKARSRGAARRLKDTVERSMERRRERKRVEAERKREAEREQKRKRAEKEKEKEKETEEKVPPPVGRKRKAETAGESESDEEPVVVPARKIRRVGRLRRE
ncbi:hypothetical protein SLS58_003248 [Diplodia intermedia]|uniref:Uncharacterized protein n=1 Tax=Diplodia intermedia TaxID=856260 RepID=A0ABR3TWK2_9PEZI